MNAARRAAPGKKTIPYGDPELGDVVADRKERLRVRYARFHRTIRPDLSVASEQALLNLAIQGVHFVDRNGYDLTKTVLRDRHRIAAAYDAVADALGTVARHAEARKAGDEANLDAIQEERPPS